MLQLKNICKSYTTASFTQKALDDVSISFRDNEFVSILGPSGSGKTTMLNIIGGLDHYDSGDLVIEGISTKEFKDRDWDAYRNNRIGFVFQSYNLIPHQTVLANVELALTLSGVSREERHNRAVAALERVGLGDHIDKKPAQLSGGQMQRVAIARALINDPEILLADEPTGALDSKTSVQIMDLLTEIADDRLVVMVTHNPELAEQYSTRIVNLADGRITSDSDPHDPTAEEVAAANAKPAHYTRMSFLTALALSANNLLTKKGRTIMTAVAGSIGIIGIAAILALANGVNNYIKTVEEDTLSVYPLQILSTGFDVTSMFVGMSGATDDADDDSASQTGPDPTLFQVADRDGDKLVESRMMTRMFASIGNNDLAALKAYFDSGESGIEDYVNDIFYEYAVTPQIFDANTADGVRQINPDTSFSSLGFSGGATSNSLLSMSMSTDMFDEMPNNGEVIEEQYDIVRGHWPEAENELVLVLSQTGRISDFMSYVLGLRPYDELKEMIRQFADEEEVSAPTTEIDVTYDDVLGMKFKLVNAINWYKYNEENKVWVDKSDDTEFMKDLVNKGEDLVIAGIVRPKEGANAVALRQGIYYTPALVEHIVDESAEAQIVKDQLADPKVDVFNGKTFEEQEDESGSSFDMQSLFSIDQGALASAFWFDAGALDFSGIDLSKVNVPGLDMSGLFSSMTPQVSAADLQAIFPELTAQNLLEGVTITVNNEAEANKVISDAFAAWLAANPASATNPSAFFNSPEGQQALAKYASYIDTDKLQAQIMANVAKQLGASSQDEATQKISERLGAYYAAQMGPVIQQQLASYMQQYMAQYMNALSGQMQSVFANLGSAMGVDADAFARAFQFNMSPEELTELMMSMMRVEERSYDNNLKKLGYADFAKPSEISIYPKDFESKEHVIEILDAYNDEMRATDEDKVISYTDIVGTLMKSVTTIIDMITTVLIAFVAISLIVSSIMIGVITYISVLERKKEIGILRSIGASKGDISRVFNAETVIEGLIAGVLGVGVTALACIPANIIVESIYDVPNVALLPVPAGVILVLISVFLTFIAGLIPSGSASRKDPVEALRSE